MSERILLVDDEKQILQALQRTLYGQGYIIFTATSARKALEIMENEDINLIISDVRMPGMDGYELLKEVKEKYPSTIRVILSGYAKSSLIVKIQRESLAKRYLYKPWKNTELIRTIGQMFNIEKQLKDKNLLEIINKIDYLPSPNNVYYKFNTLVKEEASIDEISKVIKTDQSVAAKVLQVANSAMYGIKTGSTREAISYIGLDSVKYIILSATTFQKDKAKRNARLNRDIEILWRHAASTNQILTYLYNSVLGKKIPDIYSALGLLHDIGKIVLMNNFTEKYMKAAESISKKKDLVYYYEDMEFTDVTSYELGAYLLNWWELPGPLVEAVLYQDQPFDKNLIDRDIVALLNIAEAYSWNYIFGGEYVEVDPRLIDFLDISREDMDIISNNINIELDI